MVSSPELRLALLDYNTELGAELGTHVRAARDWRATLRSPSKLLGLLIAATIVLLLLACSGLAAAVAAGLLFTRRLELLAPLAVLAACTGLGLLLWMASAATGLQLGVVRTLAK